MLAVMNPLQLYSSTFFSISSHNEASKVHLPQPISPSSWQLLHLDQLLAFPMISRADSCPATTMLQTTSFHCYYLSSQVRTTYFHWEAFMHCPANLYLFMAKHHIPLFHVCWWLLVTFFLLIVSSFCFGHVICCWLLIDFEISLLSCRMFLVLHALELMQSSKTAVAAYQRKHSTIIFSSLVKQSALNLVAIGFVEFRCFKVYLNQVSQFTLSDQMDACYRKRCMYLSLIAFGITHANMHRRCPLMGN